MNQYDVIVIGGGQSALACAYYLKKTALDYIILDNQQTPGGSWLHTWDTLTLFSAAGSSSLPGWLMPQTQSVFPSREEVLSYLSLYEQRYGFHIKRPVEVTGVRKTAAGFEVQAGVVSYFSKAVIAATGSWKTPYIPDIKGQEDYKGTQLHSAHYKNTQPFIGSKVLVVGGGNSGAQLFAELSMVTETVWSTLKPPTFLPDDVDGRVLFNIATQKYLAQKQGKPFDASIYNLGNIVMVPSVLSARERGVLHSKGPFIALYESGVIWENGSQERFDAIIWCTGFKPATQVLKPLNIVQSDGKIKTTGSRATQVEGLWLVGYGSWTGFATATLLGVGRSARDTVNQLHDFINIKKDENSFIQ